MIFGLPVAARATLTAFSTASAPELAKKKLSIEAGTICEALRSTATSVYDDDIDLCVEEETGLCADRFNHFGMAVTGIGHANTAGEVEQFAPILRVNVRASARSATKLKMRDQAGVICGKFSS